MPARGVMLIVGDFFRWYPYGLAVSVEHERHTFFLVSKNRLSNSNPQRLVNQAALLDEDPIHILFDFSVHVLPKAL